MLTIKDVEELQRVADLYKIDRQGGGDVRENQMDREAWAYADQETERRRRAAEGTVA